MKSMSLPGNDRGFPIYFSLLKGRFTSIFLGGNRSQPIREATSIHNFLMSRWVKLVQLLGLLWVKQCHKAAICEWFPKTTISGPNHPFFLWFGDGWCWWHCLNERSSSTAAEVSSWPVYGLFQNLSIALVGTEQRAGAMSDLLFDFTPRHSAETKTPGIYLDIHVENI